MSEVIQSLMNHRSVRKYQDKPVEPEIVDLILKTGIRAATENNLQPYTLVVVEEDEQKEVFGLAHAPLAFGTLVELYCLKR